MAMKKAMKATIQLQGLLVPKINYDSMSAFFFLAKNHVYHVRTKHIDVRFHFIREILDQGDIEL